jgi:hypothetical protein
MKPIVNWLLSALVLTALGACQSQPSETSANSLPAQPIPALPATKPIARRADGLNWPVGYVDTLQHKQPKHLRLTPSSQAAFARLPEAAPDTSESHCLRVAGPSVRRTGKVLTLPLCQGTRKLLTYDQTENPDSSIRYTFAGTVSGANQWLVATTLWEGFYYTLIDRCSGRQQYAWNYPVPSPDKKFFISANSDLDAHYTPTGLQLWSITPTGVHKIWQREWPEDAGNGPAEVRWQNAHTVLIKQEFLADSIPPHYVALDLNQLLKQ